MEKKKQTEKVSTEEVAKTLESTFDMVNLE